MERVRKTLKKYFVPHEENDHKPHLLRARSVAFVLLVAFAMESVFLFGTSYLAPKSRLFGIVVANTLVDETNQNRAVNSEPTLTVDPLLQAAAQEKANDMVANNYFAHTSPAGLTPWYWFEQVGYNFTYAGENLAVNFSDSQDVTNAWMSSPEHRANILNGNFTDIGIATAQGQYQGHPAVYVVELFGTPAPAVPVAFINSASAANTPALAPTVTKTPSKPAPKVSGKASSTKVIAVPTVVASSSLTIASSNQTFVAVKGAETQTVPSGTQAAPTVMTSTEAVPAAANSVAESNLIQSVLANPRQAVDYVYFAILLIFAIALLINVFVKIRIQHAQVIFGGMLIVLVVGMLIVFNLHMIAGTVIL